MYYLYLKDEKMMTKNLVGEYKEVDDAFDKIDALLEKDENVKYVLEESTGGFNSYGEMLTMVVTEN
ncbi:MAG: hypothetical protein MJ229_00515 [bacterium]|nr:hypothetical protein [bacterium]